ncbi:MAG: hypothetical protein Q8P41_22150, partial [Pseudomonadota bacterium]|nr:hypothetical protein [Pseudomonadota bacterium]
MRDALGQGACLLGFAARDLGGDALGVHPRPLRLDPRLLDPLGLGTRELCGKALGLPTGGFGGEALGLDPGGLCGEPFGFQALGFGTGEVGGAALGFDAGGFGAGGFGAREVGGHALGLDPGGFGGEVLGFDSGRFDPGSLGLDARRFDREALGFDTGRLKGQPLALQTLGLRRLDLRRLGLRRLGLRRLCGKPRRLPTGRFGFPPRDGRSALGFLALGVEPLELGAHDGSAHGLASVCFELLGRRDPGGFLADARILPSRGLRETLALRPRQLPREELRLDPRGFGVAPLGVEAPHLTTFRLTTFRLLPLCFEPGRLARGDLGLHAREPLGLAHLVDDDVLVLRPQPDHPRGGPVIARVEPEALVVGGLGVHRLEHLYDGGRIGPTDVHARSGR